MPSLGLLFCMGWMLCKVLCFSKIFNMWGACVYPEEYLLLRYILTSLLLHTNRTIRAPYEVSIPYESIAPLCGASILSGTGGGLSLGSPKGHYKDPFPKSPPP